MVSWAAPTLRRTTFFFFWNHFERTPAEFERTKKYAEYAGGEALLLISIAVIPSMKSECIPEMHMSVARK